SALTGSAASRPNSADISGGPYLVVLGVAQDGGYPQPGCRGACCREAWKNPGLRRRVASVAIVDPESSSRWLVDATPDFPERLGSVEPVGPAEEHRAAPDEGERAGEAEFPDQRHSDPGASPG